MVADTDSDVSFLINVYDALFPNGMLLHYTISYTCTPPISSAHSHPIPQVSLSSFLDFLSEAL